MASFTIVSEGSPIIPYNLNVSFPINHTATYVDPVVSDLPYPSQAFTDFFNTYVGNTENHVKTWPEFTTQDTTRNATWTVEEVGPFSDDPSKTLYNLTQVFTIENAVVQIPQTALTDLTGDALDNYLQSAANDAEANYFANRPWSPL